MATSDDSRRSGSPSDPPEPEASEVVVPVDLEQNKRDTERIQILGELHGEVMVFQPLAIKEISRGGAQVETTFPLHLDSLHDVRLTLGDQSVVLKARVAHCSISDMDQELVTYRSGLEFVEPSEPVFSVISGFIDAIRDGRRAG